MTCDAVEVVGAADDIHVERVDWLPAVILWDPKTVLHERDRGHTSA